MKKEHHPTRPLNRNNPQKEWRYQSYAAENNYYLHIYTELPPKPIMWCYHLYKDISVGTHCCVLKTTTLNLFIRHKSWTFISAGTTHTYFVLLWSIHYKYVVLVGWYPPHTSKYWLIPTLGWGAFDRDSLLKPTQATHQTKVWLITFNKTNPTPTVKII